MPSNKNDQNKKQPAFMQAVFLFVLITLIIFVSSIPGLYRCPLRFLSGIPCPLCGISRAVRALLSGDLRTAFYYHPLWPVIMLSLILYILYILKIIRVSKRIFNIYCFILAAAILCCYVMRHINGSPVVSIHFEESLLGRLAALFP